MEPNTDIYTSIYPSIDYFMEQDPEHVTIYTGKNCTDNTNAEALRLFGTYETIEKELFQTLGAQSITTAETDRFLDTSAFDLTGNNIYVIERTKYDFSKRYLTAETNQNQYHLFAFHKKEDFIRHLKKEHKIDPSKLEVFTEAKKEITIFRLGKLSITFSKSTFGKETYKRFTMTMLETSNIECNKDTMMFFFKKLGLQVGRPAIVDWLNKIQ